MVYTRRWYLRRSRVRRKKAEIWADRKANGTDYWYLVPIITEVDPELESSLAYLERQWSA